MNKPVKNCLTATLSLRKKNLAPLMLIFTFFILLSGCEKVENRYSPLSAKTPLNLWVSSDLHYLDPSLTAPGPVFEQTYKNADGKQTADINTIVDALIRDAQIKKPNALILSGDLTFNGEEASHEGLAKKLQTLEDSGVAVLVIPGNHDLNNFYAYSYAGEKVEPTQMVSPADFEKIYANFGYKEALSRDPNSLSYVFELSKGLRVLMLDTCIYEHNSRLNPSDPNGRLKPETLTWLKEQLEEAKVSGAKCLSVTHHNLLIHNSQFFSTFTIANNNALFDLYKQYGVVMNLSGHMHIQHIETAQTDTGLLADIATSSLAVNGNAIGQVLYTPDKSFSYERLHADVTGYAKSIGSTDPKYLDFSTYSKNFFYDLSYERTYKQLLQKPLADETAKEMADVLTQLNLAYFDGSIDKTLEKLKNTTGFKAWESMEGDFSKNYFNTMIKENQNHQKITIGL